MNVTLKSDGASAFSISIMNNISTLLAEPAESTSNTDFAEIDVQRFNVLVYANTIRQKYCLDQ